MHFISWGMYTDSHNIHTLRIWEPFLSVTRIKWLMHHDVRGVCWRRVLLMVSMTTTEAIIPSSQSIFLQYFLSDT